MKHTKIPKEAIIQKEALRQLTLEKISEKVYLGPDALAIRWNMAKQTLCQWRWKGKRPHFTKMGRKILYALNEIEECEALGFHKYEN